MNANIIASSGGPCTSEDDCTGAEGSSLFLPADQIRAGLTANVYIYCKQSDNKKMTCMLDVQKSLASTESLDLRMTGPDKSFACRFTDPGFQSCVVSPDRSIQTSIHTPPSCLITKLCSHTSRTVYNSWLVKALLIFE